MIGNVQRKVVIVLIICLVQGSLVTSKRISIFHFPDEIQNEILHDSTDTGNHDDPITLQDEEVIIEENPDAVLVKASSADQDIALQELADEILAIAVAEENAELFSEFIDHKKPPSTTWEYMKESLYGIWTLICNLFAAKRR